MFNVLIIGPGYAGKRYINAFQSLEGEFRTTEFNYAYVAISKKDLPFTYYSDIDEALKQYLPDVIVVAVSDGKHAEVLFQLEGYSGFILCEKPLVNSADDLHRIQHALSCTSGFCMDMVERYSEATDYLKNYIRDNSLTLLRANFIWGKDRIHDHRTTCGVPSEIIHSLDLVEWVGDSNEHLELDAAIGTESNFSISGDNILDSVSVTARLGEALITGYSSGYSSFTNIIRQRTLDFIFSSPEKELVYARLTFDTPEWDNDHLRLWKHTKQGDELIQAFSTSFDGAEQALKTIQKLRKQVREVIHYILNKLPPEHDFTDLNTSLRLQRLLNTIEHKARRLGPANYVLKYERELFTEDGSLEQLG
ncbi:Gfo/Idh/MocA family oxidoreductase [Salmonella enterica]|nr:Gfo/Idh/MocA family oxidoreductase [Salmonella enterica]EIG8968263.1 Gfo/Idh/MocA family oxidoreductase [Salmonella enterica]EJE9730156.1 Gfo/Idh/MocA family oxidoreductase [Salmonella enterica]